MREQTINCYCPEDKIYQDKDEISHWIKRFPRPLVFTNGCFDILHRGHVSYLEIAANLGASLIVALNSDESVGRLGKAPGRPVNSLEDRLAVVASVECVSGVISFSKDTPLVLINTIMPDILVKGEDWPIEKIVGAEEVSSWGGEVHSIAFKFRRSTTELFDKVRKAR